jgi:DUF1680 family protein
MLAADYPISTCFTDPQGIYVNLYIPGRVDWRQDSAACRVSITTDYPYASTVTMGLQLSRPRTFALHLRIPAWATGASVSVNGKRTVAPIVPGAFAAVAREWRSGDRVELDLPLRQRLQAVDAQHPETVALSAGPLVLMRILDDGSSIAAALPRAALLAAERVSSSERRWTVSQDSQRPELRAFADIGAQRYSAYQDVAG